MIQQRIESDYEYVESLGYRVLGVFLQGSQNYDWVCQEKCVSLFMKVGI